MENLPVREPKNDVAAYVRTQRRVHASRSVYHVDKSKD